MTSSKMSSGANSNLRPKQSAIRAKKSNSRPKIGRAVLADFELVQLLLSNELLVRPLLDPERQIQPASIDLRLGNSFSVIQNAKFEFLDLLMKPEEARRESSQYLKKYYLSSEDRFVLHPGEFALASTLEYLRLPNYLCGRLEGKSTWGRLGLQIHSTAGFVDPGFTGVLTLELKNVGKAPIPLYTGLRIAQISFYTTSEVGRPYGNSQNSKYSMKYTVQDSLYFGMHDLRVLAEIHKTKKLLEEEV